MTPLHCGTGAVFLALASLMQPARAQDAEATASLAKARLLYSCSYFFRASSQASEADRAAKLTRIANQFLVLATAQVVAADPDKSPGNVTLARVVSGQGEADFKALMEEVERLPQGAPSNERLGRFVDSCTKAVAAPAPPPAQ